MVLDPHLIPGFELLGRVASGGVAEVFRARRLSDGAEIALKVTSLADLDPEFQPDERFRREALLLARLDHPSLPHVYGAGVTDGGLAWLALELVRGAPLSAWARRSPAELLPVFIQVAEGLQAVAQEGIVHRDVSPDNVLVEERRGRPRARLIDFGIAKDLLGGGELTRVGAFLGKLQYASPEQLLGPPPGEALDFRSDIYSLGLTMYEVLSGTPAISSEELPDIIEAHRRGFPPVAIPPEHPPAPRLAALVARMTRESRDERPQSWEEVLAELWRCREEVSPIAETLARKGARTTVALPPETRARLKREVLLGRLVLGAGIAAVVAALAFTAWVLGRRPPETEARPVPEAPTPAATPAPVAPPARRRAPRAALPAYAPLPAATRAPRPAVQPTARPTPRPTETAPATLDVALVPAGDLDEVRDERGRVVASSRALPARLTLPPGRYTLRLVARGIDCVKTPTVTLRAGRTASVRESCIEVK